MSADMEMKITVLAFIALIMTGSLFFRYYLDGREISDSTTRYGFYILAADTMEEMLDILGGLDFDLN